MLTGTVPLTGPIAAPKILRAFKNALRVKPKTPIQGGGGLRPRWKDKKHIYEWDSRHGAVEKYSKNVDKKKKNPPISTES